MLAQSACLNNHTAVALISSWYFLHFKKIGHYHLYILSVIFVFSSLDTLFRKCQTGTHMTMKSMKTLSLLNVFRNDQIHAFKSQKHVSVTGAFSAGIFFTPKNIPATFTFWDNAEFYFFFFRNYRFSYAYTLLLNENESMPNFTFSRTIWDGYKILKKMAVVICWLSW